MAMSTTRLATNSASTSDTTAYNGNSGTPASGDLLIAFVGASNTVSVGGLTGTFDWTLLDSFSNGGDTLYVYYAYASSATSITPHFDCSDDAATGCSIQVLRLTGLDGQTQPYIRQYKFTSGNSTNCVATLNSSAINSNGMIGSIFKVDNSGVSAPTSWTGLGTVAYSNPYRVMLNAYRNSGETGSSFTWAGSVGGSFIAFIAELYVAGSGKVPLDEFGQSGFFGI